MSNTGGSVWWHDRTVVIPIVDSDGGGMTTGIVDRAAVGAQASD